MTLSTEQGRVREAFEAWHRERHPLHQRAYEPYERDSKGYVFATVRFAYEDWLAAWQASAEACAKAIESKADATVANWQHGPEDMVEDSKARAWDYLQCAIECRKIAAP